MTVPLGSPPGPAPSPPSGPATGFGGRPPSDPNTPTSTTPIVPRLVIPSTETVQLVRGIYPVVSMDNAGAQNAWVGPRGVTVGTGTVIRPGRTRVVAATDSDGLWAIAEPGGAVLEMLVVT